MTQRHHVMTNNCQELPDTNVFVEIGQAVVVGAHWSNLGRVAVAAASQAGRASTD